AGVLDAASGKGGGGTLSVLRKTSSRTESTSASAGIGVALSTGVNETEIDLLDMNGDRYPDQVSASGVRFSNGVDGFGELQSFQGLGSAVRRSKDANGSTSIGIGIHFTKNNGRGKPAAVLSTLPSVGTTVSFTQTVSDLIDVNGDGLPDRVSIEPGSDEVTVRLNLGYHFGAPERWSLPSLPSSSDCTDHITVAADGIAGVTGLDTRNGLAFTRSAAANVGVAIGPFGGGVSTTLARTLVDLVDVNGDGLPDRVAKDHNDDFFRVQLNLGDRWDSPQRWYVPHWSASIGDAYNPRIEGKSAFQCLDAVSFSGHVELNGSIGAPICIPLVPPVVVAGLQIEASVQAFGSTSSGLQLFLEDLDGDGFADHILKRTGDQRVYVKRNQASRVNLLRAVHRPLGSTIELGYERRGNHANMPFSQWVLAQVSVADGRGNQYVTRYQYGNDAYYDRAERENYGYPHVRITLPDGSTIDRDFLNGDLYSRHLQTREALADASGNLFRVSAAQYVQQPDSGPSRFPALVGETISFYEGTASAEKQTSRTYEYDSLGNVIRTTDFADAGADDDVVTVIEYSDVHPAWPTSIEVKDGNGLLLRRRRGTYDARGNVTLLEQTLIGGRDPATGSPYSGSKNAVSTFTYDPLGNLATSTDPTGYTSAFTYDGTTK
ncbi:MAG TPA: toxin TcdB middle/N-terminal domain-containing protein, partial [Vicinamibacterales bacterium]|nr:toxin TcdB middle/N-terminal domain-containing protein [Vicinamibacterales bacterium]